LITRESRKRKGGEGGRDLHAIVPAAKENAGEEIKTTAGGSERNHKKRAYMKGQTKGGREKHLMSRRFWSKSFNLGRKREKKT